MRVYHRTGPAAANGILTNGFRDGRGQYMTDREFTGVWVSDTPIDAGGLSDVLLALDIPDDIFKQFEWVADRINYYRESLIPAAVLNRYGPPIVVDENASAAPEQPH